MKKLSYFLYILSILSLTLAISCSDDQKDDILEDETLEQEEIDEETIVSESDTTIVEEILQLINEYRQSKNLSSLTMNSTANQLAADHTQYMISQGKISHDDFSLRADALNEQEGARATAENVASSYPDAESVVNAWIASEGHRKNIEGTYTHTGIAVIQDENNRYYYTQLFFR
ncbi:CAP domain-containing protein [Aquimarina pacifica]|uniref:CAP domain-containing protein n=1 Tax=Aquimarina pacifica TaxID=1296415 RepID=UPI00046E6AF2|nr:CAP domain-containing protein [Aquimarina pacifica]